MSSDKRSPAASAPDLGERLEVVEALRKSQAKNQALLNAIPDLMLQLGRDGTLLDCHVGELAPYRPPSMILGKRVDEILPAEVGQQIMRYVARTLRLGATQTFEYQLTGVGGPRDYEARMVICDGDEVLAIVRDITERKRAEKEAIRTERLTALGLLAAAVAHEINNPLQILKSHLDLVLDFPLEPGESEKYLRVMRYQVERLNAITQRVLDFAHPKPLPRQPVWVTGVLRQVLAFAAKQLQQNGIRVTSDFRTTPPALAVRDQLEQVLLNLVLNAVESMPTGGRLHLAVYPEDDQAVVAITNSGPPIPPEALAHLFEAFFTTKPEGRGLGLWISHGLVQQHDGSLTAENLAGGQGVVFRVKLPCAPSSEATS